MGDDLTPEIVGVRFLPRRVIADERGGILHMLRCDDEAFTTFGEVYFSEIRPGQIKAWKRHKQMTQRFAVPVGTARFVVHDDRPTSATRGVTAEHVVGREAAYGLLVIPPRVWYGFQALSGAAALIVNCADIPHDPAEGEFLAPGAPGAPEFVW